MELATRATGKINFGWNVVLVIWDSSVHDSIYRGSPS
jgi:hypothetical protein